MLLLEHDGKALLARHGIPIPAGTLVAGWLDETAVPQPGPWMVKAQAPVGGRGKAGAIRRVGDPDSLKAAVAKITGMSLRGFQVQECLVEQAIESSAEYYVSLSVEPSRAAVAIVLSDHGGVDIEDQPIAALAVGYAPFDEAAVTEEIGRLAAGLESPACDILRAAAKRLAPIFLAGDLLLLEVNPLLARADGSWVAADAKVIFDENALSRQAFMEARLSARAGAYPADRFKREQGFDFMLLDRSGRVGLVTTGAGLTMQVVDELAAQGVSAYNFCDIRSGMMRGDPARLILALSRIAEGPGVRAVLVNIFAGITNLGEFASLLVTAAREAAMPGTTFVVRLIGNAAAEGEAVLRDSGLPFVIEPDLDAAVAKVAELAKTEAGDA